MKLRTIAHSRSGDKGTIVNVSLIAFESRYYPALVEHVTAARVKEHFIGLATGEVVRYELPLIGALNFVVHGMGDESKKFAPVSHAHCTMRADRASASGP